MYYTMYTIHVIQNCIVLFISSQYCYNVVVNYLISVEQYLPQVSFQFHFSSIFKNNKKEKKTTKQKDHNHQYTI